MNEDQELLNRLEREPERKIFTIDVGNLPKGDAEAYEKQLMQKYKDKGLKFPDPNDDTYETL
jgi:hypothetical protein